MGRVSLATVRSNEALKLPAIYGRSHRSHLI